MYAVGTPVLYSRMGVCQVESIAPFPGDAGRRYYKLRALFSSSGERIYIPVDAASSLRRPIGRGEAAGYLRMLPRLKPALFSSPRPAELAAHYREILGACEPEECLILLKEIYLKERALSARSKKLGQVDSKYRKVAERIVCEEFALALDTTPDSMRDRLYEAMGAEQ